MESTTQALERAQDDERHADRHANAGHEGAVATEAATRTEWPVESTPVIEQGLYGQRPPHDLQESTQPLIIQPAPHRDEGPAPPAATAGAGPPSSRPMAEIAEMIADEVNPARHMKASGQVSADE
ncbi:hypothetical protein [Kitasatospora sp. NPDC058190]|uniref:hypothetical protein n=1 Tax=Kitasatospora sp. NPDC058190 TaxID=3346371 RepID=UPI0036D907A4